MLVRIKYFNESKSIRFQFLFYIFRFAGSASVHLQLLSPVSRNLFQRAILMSGTALNRWALSEEDDHMFDMFAISKSNRFNKIH